MPFRAFDDSDEAQSLTYRERVWVLMPFRAFDDSDISGETIRVCFKYCLNALPGIR